MNLLLCMSLCGTIFLLFVICLDHFALTSIGARFVYRLYKLALLLYLLPFQYFKFRYPEFLRLPGASPDTASSIVYYDNSENLSFAWGHKQYFFSRVWALFFIVGAVIFVIYLIKQARSYQKERCQLDLRSSLFCDPLFDTACRSFQKQQQNIKLYRNPCIHSPITVGIFHPRIIFPFREYSEKERHFLYRHELFHIKSHDTLIKLLCLLAIAVHWYNPFVYLLYWKINQLCEYACDENVLDGASEDDKKIYCTLLIRLSVSEHPNVRKDSVFGRSFSEHKNTLEKRLLTMITFSSKKHLKKFAVFMTGLTLFLSFTITVSAYAPVTSSEDTVSKPEAFSFNSEDYFFVPNGMESEPLADFDFSLASQVFMDEDGVCYPVSDSGISTYASCSHSYVSGKLNTHAKNASGGCKVTTYNARRCTKCGHTIKGSYINSLSYAKCPH